MTYMFKLRNLKFYSQNELISNLMHATGLKIVGTGACLPWCSISSSFQKWSPGSFCSFRCWNLVPFLPDIGFQLLKSLWSSLTYFSFNDLDCRQANSAPGLFYYKAMLL